MSVDEVVLDFDVLGEFEQEGRRMIRIMLVAAQRVMVDAVVAAAEGAKLDPIGLDLVPFALVRAVGATDTGMDLEQEGDEAVIDVGAHVTNICVHSRGLTRFVRILPSGGRDVTLAIARSLGVEDEVAERLKKGEEVEGAPAQEDVRRAAMSRAGSFVDEIRSSLEFYTAQAQGARISRVLVTGGGSKLVGLPRAAGRADPGAGRTRAGLPARRAEARARRASAERGRTGPGRRHRARHPREAAIEPGQPPPPRDPPASADAEAHPDGDRRRPRRAGARRVLLRPAEREPRAGAGRTGGAAGAERRDRQADRRPAGVRALQTEARPSRRCCRRRSRTRSRSRASCWTCRA